MTKDARINSISAILILFIAFSWFLPNPAAAIDFEIVPPVVVNQLDGDPTEQQRFPNLLFENEQLSLYFHSDGAIAKQLRIIKFNSIPQLLTDYELIGMNERYGSFAPYVGSIDSYGKMLFWYEPDHSAGSNPLDYQYITFFEGEKPTSSELENSYRFYPQEDHYDIYPDFGRVGDQLYFASLRSYESNPAHNSRELFLKSYDLLSKSLNAQTLYFSSNGEMALFEKYEKLFLIKSWVFCTDYENLSCVEWSSGYKAYTIEDNKIKNIFPLLSFDSFDKSDNPTDISIAKFGGQELFVLHNERQIAKMDYDRMRLELVADLFNESPFYVDEIIPLLTADYIAVAFVSHESDNVKFCLYDYQWQFVDSVSVPLMGVPLENSDMVYSSSKDAVTFAYSSYSSDSPNVSRIYLQTVGFSERKLYHIPIDIVPGEFKLAQNYPNPFNPETFVDYYLPKEGRIKVEVFNLLGQKVETLIDDYRQAGVYETTWDGSGNSSGIYLIRAEYGDESKSVKAVLIK